MRAVISVIPFLLLASTQSFCNQEPETNVNSRYTVESVEIAQRAEPKLSSTLKNDINSLVGQKFNQEMIDKLSARMKKELHSYKIVQRITKGTKPENVRVVFDVVRQKYNQDLVLPRLVYNSKENFSFGADADLGTDNTKIKLGILTDNDTLEERYSGVRGSIQRYFADGRVRPGVQVESFRSQWNSAVENALAKDSSVPGIYRTRLHIQPDINIDIMPGVTLTAGFSMQRVQTQFPAAKNESSQSAITSLRFHRHWDSPDTGIQTFEAGYNLRAATRILSSDFVYARHSFNARYSLKAGQELLSVTFLGGVANGNIPLFDRFMLGNSTTLRGYNKYDVAPTGGNRMAHGSVDYRHDWLRVVYDTGVVFNKGGQTRVLHSLAGGVTMGARRDSFSFLVAFPLKDGHGEPIFILGMNF